MNYLFETISEAQAIDLRRSLDLVIVTATDIESQHVWRRLIPVNGAKSLYRTQIGSDVFIIGTFGIYLTAHVQCEMGSGGVSGSALVTAAAISFWDPSIVLMTGIAFGLGDSQKMGEVLISNAVYPYELARIGTRKGLLRYIPTLRSKIEMRGTDIPAGINLLSRFRHARAWIQNLPYSVSKPGRMISGEKLLDNFDTKNFLKQNVPVWIGGEMEGAGLSAAAHRESVQWIIVKSICDWGDGTKQGDHQDQAAENSTDYAYRVLSIPFQPNSKSPKIRPLPSVGRQNGHDVPSTFKALTEITERIRESFENPALLDSLQVLLAEIIDNIFHHGNATEISISIKGNKIILEDNGVTFDPTRLTQRSLMIDQGFGMKTFESFQESFANDVTFSYVQIAGRNRFICAFGKWSPGAKGIDTRRVTNLEYEDELVRTYKELEVIRRDGQTYVIVPRSGLSYSPIGRHLDLLLLSISVTKENIAFVFHKESSLYDTMKKNGFRVMILGKDFYF